MESIGKTIRSFRKSRKLSLKQVADHIGCNPSYLSQVENNKLDPSASRLKEIAAALGTTIVQLLSEESHDNVILRKSDRQRVFIPASKLTIEILVHQSPEKKIDARVATISPGGGSDGGYAHDGEEFGYVLKGVMELTIEDQNYYLNEGDTFYYSSQKKHKFKNNGDEDLQILWVNHPPSW